MGVKGFIVKTSAIAAFGLFSLQAVAAPVVLDNTFACSAGNAINGISIGDVTGNAGGATECWGTFDGNDPGPSGEGFDVGGTIFEFVAKEDTPGGLSGADIGLVVSPSGGASSGTWAFDSTKFAPTEFLIVLKAANSPGYAAWLFDGSTAASDMGDWMVAWTNKQGVPRDLSHLSVYAPTVIPVPAAVWLFGSGLLGLVAVARRRRA
jgi:hypothetical protein